MISEYPILVTACAILTVYRDIALVTLTLPMAMIYVYTALMNPVRCYNVTARDTYEVDAETACDSPEPWGDVFAPK